MSCQTIKTRRQTKMATYGNNSVIWHPGKGHIMEHKIAVCSVTGGFDNFTQPGIISGQSPSKGMFTFGLVGSLVCWDYLNNWYRKPQCIAANTVPWKRVLELNIGREIKFACIFFYLSALGVMWPAAFKLPLQWTPISMDCKL